VTTMTVYHLSAVIHTTVRDTARFVSMENANNRNAVLTVIANQMRFAKITSVILLNVANVSSW